ncbi:MAG: hypothetical protein ACJA2S_003649 [Cyclobacteriaceae bacterium]|jgi:hypothetical protein
MRTIKLLANILIVLAFSSACSQSESGVEGEWKAKWTTDPASYPGVDASVKFTMDGQFEFSKDGRVTISAYGHKGCIFSSDTLIHSLNWNLNNDTLKLVNENDVHGMTYSVLTLTSDKMKLQLMEDIFLDLEKI